MSNASSLIGSFPPKKRDFARMVRDRAGDLFFGGLTTGLATVILGLDIGVTVGAAIADLATGGVEPGRSTVFVPEPNVARRGVVVTAHGTTQHAGSFKKLAEHLNSRGYVVVSMDLRGHGRNYHGVRGKKSEREVNYEKSVKDLIRTCRMVRADFPGLPIYCVGESVGASVATKAVASKPGLVDGIVLCSTGARPYIFNPLLVVPDFVKGIFQLDEPIDVSRYIDRYSSDDRRVSNEMIADPLSRISLTPRELLRTAWFLGSTPSSARKIDPAIPVLLVQGSIDNLVAKHGMGEILRNLKSSKKEMVVLHGAGHVLLGTSYLKPALVEALITWLDTHSARTGVPFEGLR